MLKINCFPLLGICFYCSFLNADTTTNGSSASGQKAPPNTSNAIHSKTQADQIEDASTKCKEGEIYKEGRCQPASSFDEKTATKTHP